MSFDLESEASLGAFDARASVASRAPRSRFSLAGHSSRVGAHQAYDRVAVEDDYHDDLPDLSQSVSSRASKRSSRRPSIVDGHASLPSGYVHSPTHEHRSNHVRTKSISSTGNDERQRRFRYPSDFTPRTEDVSPYDSVSLAGSADKRANAEFVSAQRSAHANETGAALASKLASVSDKLPPESRRRLSTATSRTVRLPQVQAEQLVHGVASASLAPSQLDRGSATSWTGNTPVESFDPRELFASDVEVRTVTGRSRTSRSSSTVIPPPRSTVTTSSRIIVDKDVIAEMSNKVVADDINLRVLEGKNVIVLKEGGSFEVVDENGETVEPVYFETPAEREAMGFPPVTPRDLHDRLKRSSDGRLGLVKQGGDYKVVPTSSRAAKAPKKAIQLRDSPKWKRMFTPI